MRFKNEEAKLMWSRWEDLAIDNLDVRCAIDLAWMWASRTQIRLDVFGERFDVAVHEAFLEIPEDLVKIADVPSSYLSLVKVWELGDRLQRWNNARAIRGVAEATLR